MEGREILHFMGYGRREVADLHVVFKTSCQRQLLNKLKHRRRICKLEAALAHERKGQRAAVVTVEAELQPPSFFTTYSPSTHRENELCAMER